MSGWTFILVPLAVTLALLIFAVIVALVGIPEDYPDEIELLEEWKIDD